MGFGAIVQRHSRSGDDFRFQLIGSHDAFPSPWRPRRAENNPRRDGSDDGNRLHADLLRKVEAARGQIPSCKLQIGNSGERKDPPACCTPLTAPHGRAAPFTFSQVAALAIVAEGEDQRVGREPAGRAALLVDLPRAADRDLQLVPADRPFDMIFQRASGTVL